MTTAKQIIDRTMEYVGPLRKFAEVPEPVSRICIYENRLFAWADSGACYAITEDGKAARVEPDER